jgi:hypothetical protein
MRAFAAATAVAFLSSAALFAQLPLPQMGRELAAAPSDSKQSYFPTSARIASNGRGFLAAWIDDRAGEPRIYASRISPQGEVIDPSGVRIDTPDQPAVLFGWLRLLAAGDGSDYLISWGSFGSDRSSTVSSIQVRRVSANGRPIGASVSVNALVIASNRSATLAMVDVLQPFTLLGRDFSVKKATVLPESRYAPEGVPAATDGENFLVVSNYRASIQGDLMSVVLMDSEGNVLHASLLSDRVSIVIAYVVWDGDHYIVTFSALPDFHTHAVIVNRDGTLAGEPFDVVDWDISALAPRKGGGAIALTGVPNFRQPPGLYAITIGTEGTSQPKLFAGQSVCCQSLAIATNAAGDSLAVWIQSGVKVSRIDFPNPKTVNIASAFQQAVASSKNPTNWIVWQEIDESYQAQIFARDVTSSDPPLQLTHATRGIAPFLSLASDGFTNVIVWLESWPSEGRTLQLLEFDADRQRIRQIQLARNLSDYDAPVVVWNGAYFLVAWQADDGRLNVAAMQPGGALLPSIVPAAHSGFRQRTPSLAPGSEVSLIVWQEEPMDLGECPQCLPHGGTIHAARLSVGGFVFDATPFTIAAGGGRYYGPDAGWNGSFFLVAWTRENLNDLGRVTFAARVATNRQWIDPIPLTLTTALYAIYQPTSVGTDGSDFFVTAPDVDCPENCRLLWRISGSGPLLASDPVAIAPPRKTRNAMVMRLANGVAAVAYLRSTDDGPFAGSQRVFYRTIGASETPIGRSRSVPH